MVIKWWHFPDCYPKGSFGARAFNKTDLVEIPTPMGPFWVNLNQTGQLNNLTRVEAFSYTKNLTRMAEMVTEEEDESGQNRTLAINLPRKQTRDLGTRTLPDGKAFIVLVDTHALGILIEAARCLSTIQRPS